MVGDGVVVVVVVVVLEVLSGVLLRRDADARARWWSLKLLELQRSWCMLCVCCVCAVYACICGVYAVFVWCLCGVYAVCVLIFRIAEGAPTDRPTERMNTKRLKGQLPREAIFLFGCFPKTV